MDNRQNDHLGVNKLGKNIKKSPMNQPSFANATTRQPPQPHVYNINKNDFRNIVQQLTGSPLREPPQSQPQRPPHQNNIPARPPSNSNNRLQRIRPPPLTPINRPPITMQPPANFPAPFPAQPSMMGRPPQQYGQNLNPNSLPILPPTPNDVWSNTAESPISAYMRYLQNSFIDSSGNRTPQAQAQGNGLLPSPRMNGPPPPPQFHGPPIHSPRGNIPLFPSPRGNIPPPPPPLLPSPTSQFLLPSPNGFPTYSPYSFLSPGAYQNPNPNQNPTPFSPNFSFSPMAQSGLLGPGPGPGPPSPGYGFPLSPTAFFPISSPRWRDHQ